MRKYSRLNASVNTWNQETDASCRNRSQPRILTVFLQPVLSCYTLCSPCSCSF